MLLQRATRAPDDSALFTTNYRLYKLHLAIRLQRMTAKETASYLVMCRIIVSFRLLRKCLSPLQSHRKL